MNQVSDIFSLVRTSVDKIFIKSSGEYSFKKFFSLAYQISQKLLQMQIKEKDIIILHELNTLDKILFLFAIWNIRAIALPIDPKITPDQLSQVTSSSNARYIISKTLDDSNVIHPEELLMELQDSDHNPFSNIRNYNAPAIMVRTSGSSGVPKLVVHSLASFISSAGSVNNFFKTGKEDSWLLVLPLHHVAGLALIFRSLINAATLYVPNNEKDLNTIIGQNKATHVSLVPTQLWRLIENKAAVENLKKCKAIFLGGSSIPRSLIQKAIENNLRIYTSYGLTEMASTVAIKKITDLSTDNATILEGCQVKISNENEIWLRGKAQFLGYYQNSEIKTGVNKEGWFNTGDLGELDKRGTLTVKGRKDNMFISGGENIYPEEIERALLTIKGSKRRSLYLK